MPNLKDANTVCKQNFVYKKAPQGAFRDPFTVSVKYFIRCLSDIKFIFQGGR